MPSYPHKVTVKEATFIMIKNLIPFDKSNVNSRNSCSAPEKKFLEDFEPVKTLRRSITN